MLRYLTIPLILMWCGCVTAAPRDFGFLSGKARVGTGSAPLDAGNNPDLGLSNSSWLGPPADKAYWVDTEANRTTFLSMWGDLKALDVGNSVDTNTNTRFSGGTVTNYYVATTGDNTTGDGSEGNPWKTISYAYSQIPTTLTQNYQINVAAGTYLDNTIVFSGKTIAPYYIRIIGVGRPILSYSQSFLDTEWANTVTAGYTNDGSGGFQGDHYTSLIYANDENIEIRGFRLIGLREFMPNNRFSENGIWIQSVTLNSGEKIIIADNEISHMGHCGVKGGDLSGGSVYVDGNYFHENGFEFYDHAMYPSGANWFARRNLSVNMCGMGVDNDNANKRDSTITHNIFIAGYQGVNIVGKDYTVVHNVTYRNKAGGFSLYREGKGGVFKNNILYENVPTVTDTVAATFDVGGSVGRYHLGFVWDYNYVESGGSVSTSTTDPVSGIPLWASETSYASVAGRVIRTTAGRYYSLRAAVGNSGVTEPTAESDWDTLITDGSNSLRYMGTSLAQNTYTNTTTGDNSAGAVFVDVSNFDFTIKTGSSAASAGTDLGYAGGALPGVWSSTQ